MRLMTWNIDMKAMSRRRLGEILGVINAQAPDVLALQEVGVGWDEDFETSLPGLGFTWQRYARRRMDQLKYGNLVALRKMAARCMRRRSAYPELLQHLRVGQFDLINIHVPNGSGFGWEKIDHCLALRKAIESVRGHVVVMGDFNAPSFETAGKAYGYGVEVMHKRRWMSMATALDALTAKQVLKLPRRSWQPDNRAGGEEWERAETWIFNSGGDHGLRDAFRVLNPVPRQHGGHFSLQFKHAGCNRPRRFDHVFMPAGWKPLNARYLTEVLGKGISDHAPLCVDVEPRG